MINQLFRLEEKRKEALRQVSDVTNELKNEVKAFSMDDLISFDYDTVKNFHNLFYSYCSKEQKVSLDALLSEKKKIRYPELQKPTYYPEIDTLDISPEEKLRLDVAARENVKRHFTKSLGSHFPNPLSVSDIEALYSLGILGKYWRIDCKECGESLAILQEDELKRYKRTWALQRKENRTEEEQEELTDLDQNGYAWFFASCEECMADIELSSPEELDALLEEAPEYYKFEKQPDLTYENL